jgi:hypothetical protein
MIAIGRCPHSNGLQFYDPSNGTFISSIDYKFQNNVTSGTKFGYQYQPGTVIYRLDETTTIFTPKFPLESTVLVHTHSPPHVATIVGLPSYDRPSIYVVKFQDGTLAEYSDTENILEAAPTSSPVPQPSLLPNWIQGGANCTLFLTHMSKPRHGKLVMHSDNQWYFCPGRSMDISSGIMIPDFLANCHNLIATGQMFRGHAKFGRVYNARAQLQLRDNVLRHVSAHGLSSLIASSSLKSHLKMSPEDKQIWDHAYGEEYDGLAALPTWEVLTEKEFKYLSKGVKALPSMAIATIMYDEFNQPKRAKYRIVVLGNHDHHDWSRESTAAPVLSQLELRLLTALAVHHKKVLKNCDVKQAFVQSSLPSDEVYLVKPPPNCPKSAPGTYWRLLRSLYGLRRAPKLWFTKLSDHLLSMGLRCSTNSQCLFVGTLIPDAPPIYVGIYVNDIIYFSPSDAVERLFESKLSTIGNVDFMGQVSHFLGIEFSWHYLPDGELEVSLTQQSFLDTLLSNLNITNENVSTYTTPYRSGQVIDSIPYSDMLPADRDNLRLRYQSLVGSLNWLGHSTRPDISTVVSFRPCIAAVASETSYFIVLYLS